MTTSAHFTNHSATIWRARSPMAGARPIRGRRFFARTGVKTDTRREGAGGRPPTPASGFAPGRDADLAAGSASFAPAFGRRARRAGLCGNELEPRHHRSKLAGERARASREIRSRHARRPF